jgi:hypothetical protein
MIPKGVAIGPGATPRPVEIHRDDFGGSILAVTCGRVTLLLRGRYSSSQYKFVCDLATSFPSLWKMSNDLAVASQIHDDEDLVFVSKLFARADPAPMGGNCHCQPRRGYPQAADLGGCAPG